MRATHYTEHIDFRAKKSIQMKGVYYYSWGRMLYRYSSVVLLWSLFWGRTVVGWTPLSTTTAPHIISMINSWLAVVVGVLDSTAPENPRLLCWASLGGLLSVDSVGRRGACCSSLSSSMRFVTPVNWASLYREKTQMPTWLFAFAFIYFAFFSRFAFSA